MTLTPMRRGKKRVSKLRGFAFSVLLLLYRESVELRLSAHFTDAESSKMKIKKTKNCQPTIHILWQRAAPQKVHQKMQQKQRKNLAQSKKTIQQVCWAKKNKKTLKETTSFDLCLLACLLGCNASNFFFTSREALIFILDSLFRASAMCNKRRKKKKMQFFNEREEKRVWIFFCSFSSLFAVPSLPILLYAHFARCIFHHPNPFLCCL